MKDGSGKALPGVAVAFTSTDKTASMVPSSGTALTDASGIASVGLVAGAQAGAFTVNATATMGGASATGSTNYSVTFPALTMSALTIGPSPLSAGGTASVAVTVLEGSSPFAPAQTVTFSSPCAAAGKAVISSPVSTVAGVASTSYIDKGCGASDVITASTTLAGARISQAGTVNVQSAVAGQLAFVSALPQNISLKGTGGAGRLESSTVIFKVLDKNGNPVSGQRVDFALTTTVGGLTANPAFATTGSDGTVSTVVAAGTVNTPVRVIATINTSITTLSDQLVISTGIPDQNSFTIATEIFNVEGVNFSGCPTPVGSMVTVRLADHFNNPAPDGTAVSFTAEGGTVDASCLTGLVNTTLTDGSVILQKGIPGSCSVRFCAANPRPSDGRVTILAYALGEESFVDQKGTNIYYQESSDPFQDLGEPFRNDRAVTDLNANANWGVEDSNWSEKPRPANPNDGWTLGNNLVRQTGEIFIDSDNNGGWNQLGEGQYNGVLKVVPTPPVQMPVTHVRGALVQVMSRSSAAIDSLGAQSFALSHCTTGTPFVNNAVTINLAIRDTNPTVFEKNRASATQLAFDLPGNILPAGTLIEFKTSNGKLLTPTSFVVPNTNDPRAEAWIYPVQMQSDAIQNPNTLACSNEVSSAQLTVKVTTPMGVITTRNYPVTD
ncbi:hypothetical protein [Massilia cavernae]|uniref:hypothetical protein n=1 Tax=Massilia cavernae TaxID=2320864 RepID=UPI003F8A7D8F